MLQNVYVSVLLYVPFLSFIIFLVAMIIILVLRWNGKFSSSSLNAD